MMKPIFWGRNQKNIENEVKWINSVFVKTHKLLEAFLGRYADIFKKGKWRVKEGLNKHRLSRY